MGQCLYYGTPPVAGYATRLNGYFGYNNLVDTFRAAKESTGDEESPNGVGNYCGYVEEGEGIRLGQVGVFGYGYKGKHEAPSSGTVTNATPIEGRLHGWRFFHTKKIKSGNKCMGNYERLKCME